MLGIEFNIIFSVTVFDDIDNEVVYHLGVATAYLPFREYADKSSWKRYP